MKKPVEAIKRWRDGKAGNLDEAAIIAYLDSIPEWPADLTRERLEELASNPPPFANNDRSDALRRLAAIAPKREKRKVELWERYDDKVRRWTDIDCSPVDDENWRKVGEAEIDA